mmetsp:Transcript_1502/g.3268  ORF Transcript_1502/g.3268 Transcript_1502/m.3268 type:complete len:476 (+) Transcript_1502:1171-2598(+)
MHLNSPHHGAVRVVGSLVDVGGKLPVRPVEVTLGNGLPVVRSGDILEGSHGPRDGRPVLDGRGLALQGAGRAAGFVLSPLDGGRAAHLVLPLLAVEVHQPLAIHKSHALERIDRQKYGTRARVYDVSVVPQPQRVQNRRLVEVRQPDQIVHSPRDGVLYLRGGLPRRRFRHVIVATGRCPAVRHATVHDVALDVELDGGRGAGRGHVAQLDVRVILPRGDGVDQYDFLERFHLGVVPGYASSVPGGRGEGGPGSAGTPALESGEVVHQRQLDDRFLGRQILLLLLLLLHPTGGGLLVLSGRRRLVRNSRRLPRLGLLHETDVSFLRLVHATLPLLLTEGSIAHYPLQLFPAAVLDGLNVGRLGGDDAIRLPAATPRGRGDADRRRPLRRRRGRRPTRAAAAGLESAVGVLDSAPGVLVRAVLLPGGLRNRLLLDDLGGEPAPFRFGGAEPHVGPFLHGRPILCYCDWFSTAARLF